MSSTLHAPEVDIAQPMLFDTMQAVVQCRRAHAPVPSRLVDELRARHLATLADAIERYNERMTVVALSA